MAMLIHASLLQGCSLRSQAPARITPHAALPQHLSVPTPRTQALLKPAGNLLAPLRVTKRVAGLSRPSSLACRASGDVLTIGSTGQTCSRIVVQLLKNGFKVQAGVDTDIGEAQEVVSFAKKLEIISSADAAALRPRALNVLDPDDIAKALGRGGARVVLVVGDVSGKRRADAGVLARVLEAILENGRRVSQMVLVSPLGGGGGGGGGGGFLGGKAKPGGRLSALEQQVVDSGVPYLIVRVASPDKVTDRYEASLVAGPPGSLPGSLQASRAQVAEAVVAAMKATKGGGSAIIEVGADPRAPEQPLARLIAQALAGGAAEEEEEDEEEVVVAKAKPAPMFGRRRPAPAVEEEEEVAPRAARRPMFSFGGPKRSAAVEEEEEEEVPRAAPRGRAAVRERPAPPQAAPASAGGPPQKKGFLSFLGVSSETAYADDE